MELRGNSIGAEGLSSLANVIRMSTTLKSIGLDWNNLGTANDQGVSKFFSAVGENRSLAKIDLSNNELGPEFGTLIASCLRSNSSLETLDLRWNKLSNQGAKTIMKGLNLNKSITILELSGNRVTDEILR